MAFCRQACTLLSGCDHDTGFWAELSLERNRKELLNALSHQQKGACLIRTSLNQLSGSKCVLFIYRAMSISFLTVIFILKEEWNKAADHSSFSIAARGRGIWIMNEFEVNWVLTWSYSAKQFSEWGWNDKHFHYCINETFPLLVLNSKACLLVYGRTCAWLMLRSEAVCSSRESCVKSDRRLKSAWG